MQADDGEEALLNDEHYADDGEEALLSDEQDHSHQDGPSITNVEPDDGRRWYMMFVYFLACLVQGLEWTPLSALPTKSKGVFPCMSDELIFWSLNLAPIIYMLVAPLAANLLTKRNGMVKSVRYGLFFSVLCTGVRLPCVFGSDAFRKSNTCAFLLLLSGAFCGFAAPFTQGSPSRFSALWFPEVERTRATAVAFMGTYLGSAASYVLSPALVPDPIGWPSADAGEAVQVAAAEVTSVRQDMGHLLLLEAILAVVPFVCAFTYFPDHAKGVNPSNDAKQEEGILPSDRKENLAGDDDNKSDDGDKGTFLETCKVLMYNRDFVILAVSCGLLQGFYSSWGASLALVLKPLGFSTNQADVFAFVGTITYVLGGYASGDIADRYFQGVVHFAFWSN